METRIVIHAYSSVVSLLIEEYRKTTFIFIVNFYVDSINLNEQKYWISVNIELEYSIND